eukprot:11183273-Lingulodinium_polyedra.AAC.1
MAWNCPGIDMFAIQNNGVTTRRQWHGNGTFNVGAVTLQHNRTWQHKPGTWHVKHIPMARR